MIAFLFTPTQVANAETTELVIEDISIDWIANQTNYKKAIFHITTNKGSYNFLLEGNTTQVGTETIILTNLYLVEEGIGVYAQTMNTSIPDTLYDAPYVSSGTNIEAMHIYLEPIDAEVLSELARLFAFVVFIAFLVAFIEIGVLDILLEGIFLASILWTYPTIYNTDKNIDDSIDLYLPYDPFNILFTSEGEFYLATPFSWWHIEEQWLLFIHYYTASWIQSRVPLAPPPTLPPHTSFSWIPDVIAPNHEVTFVSTSYDPDGEIVSWHWWFGDGSEGYGETTTHLYSKPGFYNVRLEVIDDDELTDGTSTAIMGIVFNVIPEAPLGTISLILVMVSALGLFVTAKKPKNHKLTPSQST